MEQIDNVYLRVKALVITYIEKNLFYKTKRIKTNAKLKSLGITKKELKKLGIYLTDKYSKQIDYSNIQKLKTIDDLIGATSNMILKT